MENGDGQTIQGDEGHRAAWVCAADDASDLMTGYAMMEWNAAF
jgi:hypothetical protein